MPLRGRCVWKVAVTEIAGARSTTGCKKGVEWWRFDDKMLELEEVSIVSGKKTHHSVEESSRWPMVDLKLCPAALKKDSDLCANSSA
jgi:hypothetical protein